MHQDGLNEGVAVLDKQVVADVVEDLLPGFVRSEVVRQAPWVSPSYDEQASSGQEGGNAERPRSPDSLDELLHEPRASAPVSRSKDNKQPRRRNRGGRALSEMAERAVKYTADKTSWSKHPQAPRLLDPSSDNYGYLAPGPLRASIVEPSHAGDPFPYHLALPPTPTQALRWTAERAEQLPYTTAHPWSRSNNQPPSSWLRACSPTGSPRQCLEELQEEAEDDDDSGWLAWDL